MQNRINESEDSWRSVMIQDTLLVYGALSWRETSSLALEIWERNYVVLCHW